MLVEVEPGVALHVEDWHVEDRGSGRPVVLIAGFALIQADTPAWLLLGYFFAYGIAYNDIATAMSSPPPWSRASAAR